MEYKRLSELRPTEKWFGLEKTKRVSITSLFDLDIIIFTFIFAMIKGEEKTIVKFAYPENSDEFHYFITRSDVIKDRLERDKELMPFVAEIKQRNKKLYRIRITQQSMIKKYYPNDHRSTR